MFVIDTSVFSYFFKKLSLLALDEATADHYADIMLTSKRMGKMLTVQDAWIMTTDRQYQLTLISHDTDMAIGDEVGVQIVCRNEKIKS